MFSLFASLIALFATKKPRADRIPAFLYDVHLADMEDVEQGLFQCPFLLRVSSWNIYF